MEKYELIANAVSNPVIIASLDGTLLHMNEGASRLLEISDIAECKNISELSSDLLQNRDHELLSLDVSLSNLNYSVSAFSYTRRTAELAEYSFSKTVSFVQS